MGRNPIKRKTWSEVDRSTSDYLAAGVSARERGRRAGLLADEAGNQPTGTGGLPSRNSHSAVANIHVRRTCAFEPHERSIAGLRQELCVHESAKQGVADVPLEPPEALCLRGSQTKSRHLYELALNSLKHLINTHGLTLPYC
jgi:hypothetical protein